MGAGESGYSLGQILIHDTSMYVTEAKEMLLHVSAHILPCYGRKDSFSGSAELKNKCGQLSVVLPPVE